MRYMRPLTIGLVDGRSGETVTMTFAPTTRVTEPMYVASLRIGCCLGRAERQPSCAKESAQEVDEVREVTETEGVLLIVPEGPARDTARWFVGRRQPLPETAAHDGGIWPVNRQVRDAFGYL